MLKASSLWTYYLVSSYYLFFFFYFQYAGNLRIIQSRFYFLSIDLILWHKLTVTMGTLKRVYIFKSFSWQWKVISIIIRNNDQAKLLSPHLHWEPLITKDLPSFLLWTLQGSVRHKWRDCYRILSKDNCFQL